MAVKRKASTVSKRFDKRRRARVGLTQPEIDWLNVAKQATQWSQHAELAQFAEMFKFDEFVELTRQLLPQGLWEGNVMFTRVVDLQKWVCDEEAEESPESYDFVDAVHAACEFCQQEAVSEWIDDVARVKDTLSKHVRSKLLITIIVD